MFQQFIQTDKMSKPVDCGKLRTCNIIPRAITKKANQSDILKTQ